ncbi:MAG: hypothetical protein WC284_18505 [Candidimonas sp.]
MSQCIKLYVPIGNMPFMSVAMSVSHIIHSVHHDLLNSVMAMTGKNLVQLVNDPECRTGNVDFRFHFSGDYPGYATYPDSIYGHVWYRGENRKIHIFMDGDGHDAANVGLLGPHIIVSLDHHGCAAKLMDAYAVEISKHADNVYGHIDGDNKIANYVGGIQMSDSILIRQR